MKMTELEAAMMLAKIVRDECYLVSPEEFQRQTSGPVSHQRTVWVQLNIHPGFLSSRYADLAGSYIMRTGAN